MEFHKDHILIDGDIRDEVVLNGLKREVLSSGPTCTLSLNREYDDWRVSFDGKEIQAGRGAYASLHNFLDSKGGIVRPPAPGDVLFFQTLEVLEE